MAVVPIYLLSYDISDPAIPEPWPGLVTVQRYYRQQPDFNFSIPIP